MPGGPWHEGGEIVMAFTILLGFPVLLAYLWHIVKGGKA